MFTEYIPDGQRISEKRVSKIVRNYISSDFTNDALPLLPVTLITLHIDKYFRLFYLVKIVRIQALSKVAF